MNRKVEALQYTKLLITETINAISINLSNSEPPSFDDEYHENILYSDINKETTFSVCKITKGQKTKILSEEEFKRIICLEGSIKIHMPQFNEEIIMSSLNTVLIPPNTKYIIEVLKDSQIIGVLKPRKVIKKSKVSKKTIYTKVLNNE